MIHFRALRLMLSNNLKGYEYPLPFHGMVRDCLITLIRKYEILLAETKKIIFV
jgi:hypothetical protein